MKNIKELAVTITYTIGLGNIDIPENIYNELEKAYDNNDTLDSFSTLTLNKYSNAIDWLAENVKEKDCMNWECEIDMFE